MRKRSRIKSTSWWLPVQSRPTPSSDGCRRATIALSPHNFAASAPFGPAFPQVSTPLTPPGWQPRGQGFESPWVHQQGNAGRAACRPLPPRAATSPRHPTSRQLVAGAVLRREERRVAATTDGGVEEDVRARPFDHQRSVGSAPGRRATRRIQAVSGNSPRTSAGAVSSRADVPHRGTRRSGAPIGPCGSRSTPPPPSRTGRTTRSVS
jgi:hypothetical protein